MGLARRGYKLTIALGTIPRSELRICFALNFILKYPMAFEKVG
jgi:hypothetical protein